MGVIYKIFLRGAAIISVMLLVPGCIPWPVSLAFSGASYATTGKSISDHVISGFTQMDCSVSRALIDQSEICLNTGDQGDLAIAVDDLDEDQGTYELPQYGEGAYFMNDQQL